MRRSVLLIGIFLFLFAIHANSQNFNSTVERLAGVLKTVQTKSKQYVQHVEVVQPGVVKVTVEEISKKGKSTVKIYEFNTADIDENTVRAVAKKDVITVPLIAHRKQRMIKLTVNQEKISYVDHFVLYAVDINNGREIAEKIKETIPVAKKIIDERLSISTYPEYLKWLEKSVGDVRLSKKEYIQKLTKNLDYTGNVKFEKSTVTEKSSSTETYVFNLSTLNANEINFDVSGEIFSISVETKAGLKNIKLLKDGVQKNYINKFSIVCGNIEQARDIQKVLKEIIPLAGTTFQKSIVRVKKVSQGVDLFNRAVGTIKTNEVEITQNFVGNYVLEFNRLTVTDNKTIQESFTYNLIDIDQSLIGFGNKGQFLFLNVPVTGGENFIKYVAEGEQKSYTNALKIYVPNIEEAIILKHVLVNMIEICTAEYKKNSAKPVSETERFKKLQANVKELTVEDVTYRQELEIINDGTGLRFKNTTVTEKSDTEELFEVNLADLDVATVKIKTSGKNVSVSVTTNLAEKVIQYYEDGEIKAYQKTIEIRADGIENARSIAGLLKQILE
jgi:hypothetical protein